MYLNIFILEFENLYQKELEYFIDFDIDGISLDENNLLIKFFSSIIFL